MKTPKQRWRVPVLAWVPIAMAVVAESASNALRGYALGTQLERFTIHYGVLAISLSGAALVAAAVVISLTQARVAWVALTPLAPARQRWTAGFGAALCLAISITAMASHILEAQRHKNGGETADRTSYAIAKADYDTAKADIDRIGTVRSPAEIKAAMNAIRIAKWAWRDTAECIRIETADERAACKPFSELRQELGRSLRLTEAKETAATASRKLDALRPPANDASADEAFVAHWWAWLMGIGVVFVATFGTVLFAKVEPAPDAPSVSAALRYPAPGPDGGVPLPAPVGDTDRHPVVVALRTARRPLNNNELATAMGVTAGESTKRRSEVTDWLTEERHGKEVLVGLVEWQDAQRRVA